MNAKPTVVFIHGLWLHASSWQPWMDLFQANGYDTIAPGWPGESDTVEASRRSPAAVAGVGVDAATEHYARIIGQLPEKPILVGHSFGGLIAQKLLGMGLARAAVAIDPAQIKGTTALPFAQLRSGFPVLGNPGNKKKAVSLTAKQFRYGFGNAISAEESDALFEKWTIPSPGRPLFEAATATFTKNAPTTVAVKNSDRGPLLLISGQRDHTVPDVVTRQAFKLYGDSSAVTELKQFADKGHSLSVDSAWREVADYSLAWLTRQGVAAGSVKATR